MNALLQTGGDGLHEDSAYVLAQYARFARWLDAADPDLVANALLLLIGRTLNMLARQKEAQGETFRQEGGFRERLNAARLEARDEQQAEAGAPECPECGTPMRKRLAKAGKNAGPRARARGRWRREHEFPTDGDRGRLPSWRCRPASMKVDVRRR